MVARMPKQPLLSGWILWLVVVAIVTLVVYAGYFVWAAHEVFTSTGLPSPMATFVSEKFQISIEYPRSWLASELNHGSHGDNEVIAAIGGGAPAVQATVSIARRTFSTPTIDDVAQWGMSRLESRLTPYETLSLGSTTAPHSTALVRRYSRTSQNPLGQLSSECMDWYTYTGSNGYDLSFCVNARYWQEMESLFLKMANSFSAQQQ